MGHNVAVNFQVKNEKVGGGLFLIAGPCVIESDNTCAEDGGRRSRACVVRPLRAVHFKASPDRRTRTFYPELSRAGSLRGDAASGSKVGGDAERRPYCTDVHDGR